MAAALMREWSSSMTVVNVRGGCGERVAEVRRKGVIWRDSGRADGVVVVVVVGEVDRDVDGAPEVGVLGIIVGRECQAEVGEDV